MAKLSSKDALFNKSLQKKVKNPSTLTNDIVCLPPKVPKKIYNPKDQSHTNRSQIDLYQLILDLPPCLKKLNTTSKRECELICFDAIQYSIWGVALPQVTVPSLGVGVLGEQVKVSSLKREPYDPISVNFTIDNHFNGYWVIAKWLDLMNDDVTGLYHGTHSKSYMADFTLLVLDEYRKSVVEFTYHDAFPTNLGEINFSDRDNNEVNSTFTFEFNYLTTRLTEPQTLE
jgi:hypothetical protein